MKLLRMMKKHTVFCMAAAAALITCFFVPPDTAYADYFDWNTLACLFATLAVVCALRNIKFFTIVARQLVRITGNLRALFVMLIAITFIGSMLIANDMALITFLPLGYFALTTAKQERYMAYLFILQNISANLGGMLTPFGNPQNLYLYSYFNIPTGEFCAVMLPPFLLAVSLLMLACLPVKAVKLNIEERFGERLNMRRTVLYLALFVGSLLMVFRAIPFWAALTVITAVLAVCEREALKMVDYPLLGTFFFFFIFAGNLSRIDAVHQLLSQWLQRDTLLVSILSCQLISNVPTAVLFSRFTGNYRALLLGVNIGGTGTLIASLASLITFSEFRILYPGHGKRYFWMFTGINAAFLLIMTVVTRLFWV